MLIPLTRKTFEDLIPLLATGAQYVYCWGKVPDLLRRLLISVVGGLMIVLGRIFLSEQVTASILPFTIGAIIGFYWLWAPVYAAYRRNAEYRKLPYCGFWQGEVLDVFVTEELIGKEETVNTKGELVIVENRERRLNIEVGDETGFRARSQVPLKRTHKMVRPGQLAEMLVLSGRPDLSRVAKISDIYIPSHDLWVSDYPYVRRDAFVEVSRKLAQSPRRARDWDEEDEAY